MTIARVLPDVSGLDKHFDYLVPQRLADQVHPGSLVRIPLHGRRVSGWILELDPESAVRPEDLKELSAVTGHGPAPELIELAGWAATRWAGRRRQFLVSAGPRIAVARIPDAARSQRRPEPTSPATTGLLRSLDPAAEHHGGVLRLPPTADPMPAVLSAVGYGPTLVVVPAVEQAMLLAARLRRTGLTVALTPDDWAMAAGGVDVVVGARSAAWAPCPGLAVALVLDEHDEGLQSERAPTWHAREVVMERCRRSGARFVLVSAAPTLRALMVAEPVHPTAARERAAWPVIDIVDRSDEEPWKRSLVTSELIVQLRAPGRRVVCVSNTTGRARLLACRGCRALARCERCEAAVVLDDEGVLACPRCALERPAACLQCRSTSFANLRPGVTRLREELEAAAGRPVAKVTGDDPGAADALAAGGPDVDTAEIHIGTEAVLHRVASADVVAFLDFDRELLAPRYRAGEQAMALLIRAARMVGPRSRGGRILVQTFIPDHEVLRAAQLADPGRLARAEADRRRQFGFPPFGALASVSGAGAAEFVASLRDVDVGGGDQLHLVRAASDEHLAEALRAGTRPPGLALRVAVDPPRI